MIYDQRAFEVQGWSMIIRAHELAPHNRRGGYHLKAVRTASKSTSATARVLLFFDFLFTRQTKNI